MQERFMNKRKLKVRQLRKLTTYSEQTEWRIMGLVISHKTALSYWRSIRKDLQSSNNFTFNDNPELTPPNADLLPSFYRVLRESVDSPALLSCEQPLDFLVSKGHDRRHVNSLTCHTHLGSLPKKAIVLMPNGVEIVSPELCLTQLSSSLSFTNLLMVMFEFYGTYDLFGLPEAISSCVPLTTADQTTKFIQQLGKTKGKSIVHRALKHCLENSASPMESALSLLLCLPYKLGGFGIESPLLNYPIKLSKATRGGLSKQHYVCDLYWPSARLAVEYDSDSYHSRSVDIARDSIKRRDLASQGIEVITATKTQVANATEMEKLARLIAKRLGKRLKCWGPQFSNKRAVLRKSIFDAIRNPPLS